MFTSLKLAAGAATAAGLWSAIFDRKYHEYCRERRRFPSPTPVGSLSIVMLAGVGWVRCAHDVHRWMTSGWKYHLKSWMCNANLQVKYVKSNVESKNLNGKCSRLNMKTWMYNPLNLNVNLNIAYGKVNVQGKNLNVARGKLNDESANSDVKQQM